MDQKKVRLIVELRKNSRQKLKEISVKQNIPVSTLFDMINRLEDEKIVEHRSLVNFEKIGYPFQVIFAIKTSTEKRERLKQYLANHSRVNNIFQINSEYDYLADAIFRNQKEIQDFVDELEVKNTILKKTIFSVIDTIQREKFLTKENHFLS